MMMIYLVFAADVIYLSIQDEYMPVIQDTFQGFNGLTEVVITLTRRINNKSNNNHYIKWVDYHIGGKTHCFRTVLKQPWQTWGMEARSCQIIAANINRQRPFEPKQGSSGRPTYPFSIIVHAVLRTPHCNDTRTHPLQR